MLPPRFICKHYWRSFHCRSVLAAPLWPQHPPAVFPLASTLLHCMQQGYKTRAETWIILTHIVNLVHVNLWWNLYTLWSTVWFASYSCWQPKWQGKTVATPHLCESPEDCHCLLCPLDNGWKSEGSTTSNSQWCKIFVESHLFFGLLHIMKHHYLFFTLLTSNNILSSYSRTETQNTNHHNCTKC